MSGVALSKIPENTDLEVHIQGATKSNRSNLTREDLGYIIQVEAKETVFIGKWTEKNKRESEKRKY